MGNATVQQRLKAIRAELKLSQRAFAKQIYISQSQYAELETGNKKLNVRIIHLIAVQFNVYKKYLKDAEAPMFNASPPDCRLNELLNIFDSLDELLQNYLLLQAREILKIQESGIAKKPEI
jgi:transcriptional regulator with XRE-family HTH domain